MHPRRQTQRNSSAGCTARNDCAVLVHITMMKAYGVFVFNQIKMTVFTFNRLPTEDEATPRFIALIQDQKRRTHGGSGRYGKQYTLQLPRDRKSRDAMEAECLGVVRRMKDTDESATMSRVENNLRDRQRLRDEARRDRERTAREIKKQNAADDKESDSDQVHQRKQSVRFNKLRQKSMRPPRSPTPSSSSSFSGSGSDSDSRSPSPRRKHSRVREKRVKFAEEGEGSVPRPERKDGKRTEVDNDRINQALSYLAQFGITGMEISGGLLPRVEVKSRLLTSDSSTSFGRSAHGSNPEWWGPNNAIPARARTSRNVVS